MIWCNNKYYTRVQYVLTYCKFKGNKIPGARVGFIQSKKVEHMSLFIYLHLPKEDSVLKLVGFTFYLIGPMDPMGPHRSLVAFTFNFFNSKPIKV